MKECLQPAEGLRKSEVLGLFGGALIIIGAVAYDSRQEIQEALHPPQHATLESMDYGKNKGMTKVDFALKYDYENFPFFDIRRERAMKLLEKLHATPTPLLLALKQYREEGYSITEKKPGIEDFEHIRQFIEWCKEHELCEAAEDASAILEHERRMTEDHIREQKRIRGETALFAI